MKQEQEAVTPRENIENIENMEKPKNEKKLLYGLKIAARKRPVLTLAAAGIVLFLGGIFVAGLLMPGMKSEMPAIEGGGVPGYDNKSTEDYAPPSPAPDKNQDGVAQPADSITAFDMKKIIYTGSISLNTDNYKGTMTKVEAYAKTAGGFVQDSTSYFIDETQDRKLNSGSITLRIPAVKFQAAMMELQKYGIPVNTSVNSTNISQQYQDIAAQLENLKIQESRLVEYLKSAEKIQDMLTIESELNRVRTEIDSRTTLIKNWDTEVAYSTIYVSVYEQDLATTEVKSPFDDMMGKISESFIASINFLLYLTSQAIVWFFKLIPFVVLIALAAFIVVRVRKKKGKKQ